MFPGQTSQRPSLEHSEMNSFRVNDVLQTIPDNTLDESICTSIMTEVKLVCHKFKQVLIPIVDDQHHKQLRKMDLWGPYFMCVVLGFILDNPNQFLVLLLTVFLGAVFVTFNSRVLGAKLSILQNVSMLGYCLFPLFLALLILKLLIVFKIRNRLLTLGVVAGSVAWCIMAARAFMSATIPEGKKFISMYPVFLFYIFIGSFVIYV